MIYQSVTALYSGKATRSFEYRKASERKKKEKRKRRKNYMNSDGNFYHTHHIPRTCSVGISSSSFAANPILFFSFSLFFFADKKLWKYRRGLRGSCNESYSFLRGWATFVPRTDCYEQGGIWAIITVIMESFLLRVMQGEININESMITTFLICLKAKRKAVVIKDCE